MGPLPGRDVHAAGRVEMVVTVAVRVCLTAAGLFLLGGMILGVWKYRWVMRPPEHRAPVYVDIAHRAALLYSFAALVLAALAAVSVLPAWANLLAAAVPLFFFAVAIGTYVLLGVRRDTDNQFERRNWTTTWGMGLLIAGEIGGAGALTVGAALGLWG